ncbi:hypothetical protein AY600_08750 [Phormidium willei BDU 130791]|nr:hypothetical protein AY600_08750 [Phormidium willei BDU 130791]
MDVTAAFRLAPDEDLVGLHHPGQARQHLLVSDHQFADGVEHLPGSVLLDAQDPGHDHGGDALARGDDQEHGRQPGPQVELGGVHGGAGGDAELRLAVAAVVETRAPAGVVQREAVEAAAVRAVPPLAPDDLLDELPCVRLGWKAPPDVAGGPDP